MKFNVHGAWLIEFWTEANLTFRCILGAFKPALTWRQTNRCFIISFQYLSSCFFWQLLCVVLNPTTLTGEPVMTAVDLLSLYFLPYNLPKAYARINYEMYVQVILISQKVQAFSCSKHSVLNCLLLLFMALCDISWLGAWEVTKMAQFETGDELRGGSHQVLLQGN